jgi:imidazolonepropionase-like amidohydrolase
VPIALGTDAAVGQHGANAREFLLMVQAGMTPRQALIAGIMSAAKLLGWHDRVGSLEAGKLADSSPSPAIRCATSRPLSG